MSKTIAQLKAEADQIRLETTTNANTAERVGTAIKDVAEYVEGVEDDVSQQSEDITSLQETVAGHTEEIEALQAVVNNIDDEPEPGSNNLTKSGGIAGLLGYSTENPEWLRVITDKDGRILCGIKLDGSVEWVLGIPTPVKNYVSDYINGTDTTTIDGLNKIVEFLEGFSTSDTLEDLLDGKVDKEEGKELVPSQYIETIENEEFVTVKLDSENKVLWGIRTDGTVYYGAGVPKQVIDYIEKEIRKLPLDEYDDIVAFINGLESDDKTLQDLLDEKVDKEEDKSLIDEVFANAQSSIENSEWLDVKTDSESKVIEGTRMDGTKVVKGDIEIDGKANVGGIESSVVSNPEYIYVETDAEGKIISYRNSDGVLHEAVGIESEKAKVKNFESDYASFAEIDVDVANVERLNLSTSGMTELQQALIDNGFNPNGILDWSKRESVNIAEPRCAIMNIISDFDLTALSKAGRIDASEGVNYDIPTQVEFWDMQGNYFKKWTLMSGQGNSSMNFIKKNMAFDFFNEDPNSEDFDDGNTFLIKIGDWVPMDSYHLKAFYTEFFRGSAMIAYKIADIVERQRGAYEDRPWKKALLGGYTFTDSCAANPVIGDMSLQIDNGALCHPDGFPVIVYQNGNFYGIFSFSIKKHRDNYHMTKNNPLHIHLDGSLTVDNIWKPTNGIQWTEFEVRNPKKLVYAEPHGGSYKYDADVAQANIAGNDDGSMDYDTWESGVSYPVGKIVVHNGHYYINSVANNTAEPVFSSKNKDDDPDFKNKTGAGWINCTNTIVVKNAIVALSTRVSAIQDLSSSDAKKAYFEQYFDIDNLTDYEVCQMFTGDTDGTGKNWQWITYDGIRWWVCEYDKDMSFGNMFHGMWTNPVAGSAWIGNNINQPLGIAISLYGSEMKAYGLSLLNSGIISSDVIKDLFIDWINRIGVDNYKKEWEKWPESPCNRDPKIDASHWQRTDTIVSGEWISTATYNKDGRCKISSTVYQSMQANNSGHNPSTDDGTWWKNVSYDATVTYSPDDDDEFKRFCFDGNSSYQFLFNAKTETTGNAPITGMYANNPRIMGYRDTFWRIYEYIKLRIDRTRTLFSN